MHNPAVAFEAVAIGVDEFALTFLFGLAHTRPTTWIQNIPKLRNLPNNWEAGINPVANEFVTIRVNQRAFPMNLPVRLKGVRT